MVRRKTRGRQEGSKARRVGLRSEPNFAYKMLDARGSSWKKTHGTTAGGKTSV